MSEARIELLEEDVHEIRAALGRLEPLIIGINATLPHLATKAELAALDGKLSTALADKPGRVFMASAIGILLAAYAAGLAGLAALPVITKLVQ